MRPAASRRTAPIGLGWVSLLAALPACAASLPSTAPSVPDIARNSPESPAPSRIQRGGEELYLSGFNIAWFDFAKDVGQGVDEVRLRQAARDLADAGGNTLRWWIHTDGSTTPEWGDVNGQRQIVGPGGSFIPDLRKALDIVAEYGVYIVPCLWSFDMLRDNEVRHPPVRDNYRLLTQDAVLEAYIDRWCRWCVRSTATPRCSHGSCSTNRRT